jgi:hypothetical protein
MEIKITLDVKDTDEMIKVVDEIRKFTNKPITVDKKDGTELAYFSNITTK